MRQIKQPLPIRGPDRIRHPGTRIFPDMPRAILPDSQATGRHPLMIRRRQPPGSIRVVFSQDSGAEIQRRFDRFGASRSIELFTFSLGHDNDRFISGDHSQAASHIGPPGRGIEAQIISEREYQGKFGPLLGCLKPKI